MNTNQNNNRAFNNVEPAEVFVVKHKENEHSNNMFFLISEVYDLLIFENPAIEDEIKELCNCKQIENTKEKFLKLFEADKESVYLFLSKVKEFEITNLHESLKLNNIDLVKKKKVINYNRWRIDYMPTTNKNSRILFEKSDNQESLHSDARYIWTLVHGGDKKIIIPGYKPEDSFGYYVTLKPWQTKNIFIETE